MIRSAMMSECGLYRYSLGRSWSGPLLDYPREHVVFVGLNPSTADDMEDDPTIRRCIAFAKAWGFDGLLMLNLFAFRATNPDRLLHTPDPYGPLNDETLLRETGGRTVVACWGVGGGLFDAGEKLVARLRGAGRGPIKCLGRTKEGHPRHPLYVPASAPLLDF